MRVRLSARLVRYYKYDPTRPLEGAAGLIDLSVKRLLLIPLLVVAVSGCAAAGISAPKPGTAAKCFESVARAVSTGKDQTKAVSPCARTILQMARGSGP